jgi:predicted Holliday junction resolvase-like endonuclease|tara:strand:+ start:3614 stop:4027 length:414 start_codon:yes stop_codon:yes gene_type:complete
MLENILLLFPLIILGGIIYYYNRKIKLLKKSFEVERELIKIDTKKRSGAVQWGKTIEHFVPFIENFPVPAEDCTFLGMPIDYVAFCDTRSKTKCSIHFVEVKSGSSFLMSKQKNIKKAIQEGRVFWHEVSVGGNNIE